MQKYFVWTTIHRKLGDIKTLVFWFRLDRKVCQIRECYSITYGANGAHRRCCYYCHSNMHNNSSAGDCVSSANKKSLCLDASDFLNDLIV